MKENISKYYMKLFSGSAHPQLTEQVARLLNLTVAKSSLTRFDDSEIKITIEEKVKGEDCVVIQSTCDPVDTHLMELAFFADALKRSEADSITAIVPYFGYSRQNQQHLPGECVSLNVTVRLLEMVGYTKIITFDFHEEAAADMFSIAFSNMSAYSILAPALKKEVPQLNAENTVIVSPDQGGIERARKFAQCMFPGITNQVGEVEKQRNLDVKHVSQAVKLHTDVAGKNVVLVDDICTSGNTLVNAANLCLTNGARSIYAAVTHADFSPRSFSRLQDSPISSVFVSDTIPRTSVPEKVRTVSIAHLVSEAI